MPKKQTAACAMIALLMLTGSLAHAQETAGPQVKIGESVFGLRITEGVEQAPVEVSWEFADGVWRATAEGLALGVKPARVGPLMTLGIVAGNAGDARRLIQIALVGEVALDAESAIYWDGSYQARAPLAGLDPGPGDVRERSAFPLTAVGDAAHGVIMGTTPTTMISYAQPWLEHRPGEQSSFGFALRMVLEPGAPERATLCIGGVRGVEFGFLEGVWETYQAAFPENFRPREGIPDGMWLTSSVYKSWSAPPDREWLRRLWCGWDWCYVPFKRAGDMYCRAEDWDYQMLGKPNEEATRTFMGEKRHMGEMSLEEFRADREQYFADYGLDCGHLFYTPAGIWVEKQLAQAKFPDAIVVNDDIPTEYSRWVTPYDTELFVQPTGTSYAERLLEDYRLLLEELDISGFAFDVCVAGKRNYGPGAELPIRGRSWDERGVFFDTGISMVQQMEFIRSLDTSDKPYDVPAIIGSAGSFTAWHSDGALMELTLSGRHKFKVPVMCMALGGKPGVIWKGYDLHKLLPDWEELSRRDFLMMLSKMADYVYLKSFGQGTYPNINYEVGMDKWQAEMPLLVELVKSGWHPLTPMTLDADAELWTGRYGQGATTSLALANPNEEDVRAGVRVDNRYLGGSGYIFVDRKDPEGELAQTVTRATTELSVSAPRRQATVLRAVLGIKTKQSLAVTARMNEGIDRRAVSAQVTAPEAELAGLELGSWPGFAVESVQVNGQALAGGARIAQLQAGANTITVGYAASYVQMTQADLDAFAFLTPESEMNFSVVAPEPQRRDYRRVAERLDRYFKFYALNAREVEAADLAVATDAAEVATPLRIELAIGEGHDDTGWSLSEDGTALRLSASDEREAIRRTEELLRILDARFEYFAGFRQIGAMHWKFYETFGLTDRVMSELMAEEGLEW